MTLAELDGDAPGRKRQSLSRQRQGRPTDAHLGRLEEIKTAAARYFYELGFVATDMRRIADAVGLHVSTLYTYIESK